MQLGVRHWASEDMSSRFGRDTGFFASANVVLSLVVVGVSEIMGQKLTCFQMSFIITIWRAVENENIPVLLHHDRIE